MKFENEEDLLMPGFILVIIVFVTLGVVGTIYDNFDKNEDVSLNEIFETNEAKDISFETLKALFAKK